MRKIMFKDELKKIFKKNDIVIYAIALMLVTAGYFNYSTTIKEDSVEASGNILNNTINEAEIGDARLVNSDDVKEETKNVENRENIEKESPIDVALSTNEANEENAEENITQNTSSVLDESSNYFANSRLERETRLASMISTYTKILEDNSISETQKAIAMQEITKINETKNAISVCENLLSTKGFENCLILVNKDSVNIVVQKKGKLDKSEVAQIQNIVSREFSLDIDKIHISEKE